MPVGPLWELACCMHAPFFMRPWLWVPLALGLASANAHAQTPMISGAPPPKHRVGLSLGWDPTWIAGLGYAHSGPVLLEQYPTQFEVALVLPVALLPSFDGARLEGGISTLFTKANKAGLAASAHTGLALADDSLGTHLGWSFAISVKPGYYAPRWSVALDLGYRTSLVTYMAHSDAVKDLFADRYPDGGPNADHGPKNGFYAFTAHRFRLGLMTGFRAGEHVGLFLTAGLQYTPQAQRLSGYAPLTSLPYDGQLGGDYRW